MRANDSKWLLFAALLLIAFGVVQLWPDDPPRMRDASRDTPGRDAEGSAAAAPAQRADAASPAGTAAAPAVAPASSSVTSPRDAVRPPGQAPFRLQVHAPAEARVGDIFDVRIELDAARPVRELGFAAIWPRRQLALIGWSPGALSQQSGAAPVEISADEPSEGSVEVSLAVANGLSVGGAGSVIVFQLQALKAGTAVIALRDLKAFDSTGIDDAHGATSQSASLTIR